MISKDRILWAGRVYQLENYRLPKLMVMRRHMNRVHEYQTFNIATPHKTWYKCLLEDVKIFQIDMEQVMCLKRRELQALVKEGMKVNEDRVRSERVASSVRRNSRDVDAGEKKLAAQQAMRVNKLKVVGTKTTKGKKKKSKNIQKKTKC